MLAIYPHVLDFWTMPWSRPFRATCQWFTPETQPLQGRAPDRTAPRWIKPLFLHRWVADTIAARLAWLKAHPHAVRYRYGRESEPCWDSVAWQRYQPYILRELSETMLLNIAGMEVERLLRVAQEHPKMIGQLEWTCAALGASEHLAQLYAELKRRHRATQARALLRAELCRFVEWDTPAEP